MDAYRMNNIRILTYAAAVVAGCLLTAFILDTVGKYGLLIVLFGLTGLAVFIAVDRWKVYREHEAITLAKKQRDGQIRHFVHNGQMILSDDNDSAVWHNISLMAKSSFCAGNVDAVATMEETQRWAIFNHLYGPRSLRGLPKHVQEVQADSFQNDSAGKTLDDVLDESLVLYVWGAQGTGKTTFLNRLSQRRIDQGERVIYIDPHSSLNPNIPASAEVYGRGKDYEAIDSVLEMLTDEIQNRYKDPETMYPMTVVIDEKTLLYLHCENAKPFMLHALTEGRKVLVKLVIGAHSRTAKAMSLDGHYDMSEGVTFVGLKLGLDQKRFAEVERDGETLTFEVPKLIEYNPPEPVQQSAQPDSEEDRIKAMHQRGCSFREIVREVYKVQNSKINSTHVNKVKSVLGV